MLSRDSHTTSSSMQLQKLMPGTLFKDLVYQVSGNCDLSRLYGRLSMPPVHNSLIRYYLAASFITRYCPLIPPKFKDPQELDYVWVQSRLLPIWASSADPEMLLTLKAIQEFRSDLFPIPPCGGKCFHTVACAQAQGIS